MGRIPCKYFAKSRAKKPFCPFGRDCFYQHLNADGTPFVFEDGVDKLQDALQKRKTRAHRQRNARALLELTAGLDAIAESLLFEMPNVLHQHHLDDDDYDPEEYVYAEDWEDEDEDDGEEGLGLWGELVSSHVEYYW